VALLQCGNESRLHHSFDFGAKKEPQRLAVRP
jgi:hypothetical protein